MTDSAHAAGGEPAAQRQAPAPCWTRRAWLAFGVGWVAAGETAAQDGVAPAALKAAYLYKFLFYIDLPAQIFERADSPLTIAVAGADDVHAELVQFLHERSVGSHPLRARRLAEGDSLAGVQLLFIGAAIDPLRSAWVRAARERQLLLVTDTPNGLKAGACINFVSVNKRVRFEVSLDAAEQHAIRISSRILALAERVVGAH
jgi:hypothetical protein